MSTPHNHAELAPVEPAPEPAHEEPHLFCTPIYKLPVCLCMLPCCTRIERGQLVCICTDCDLHTVVGAATHLYEVAYVDLGHALDHGPPDDPPM